MRKGLRMSTQKRILVIDDELNLRRTLSIVLQRGGYAVTTAADAQEALRILIGEQFDLTFLDLKMPGMDGTQLLPEMRMLYPDMPILILTANASLETAIETLRLGARGYLLKPVDPNQILSRVDEVFGEQKERKLKREIADQLHNMIHDTE